MEFSSNIVSGALFILLLAGLLALAALILSFCFTRVLAFRCISFYQVGRFGASMRPYRRLI